MQRLVSIDCLRGLAALGVVLHHACRPDPARAPAGPPLALLEGVFNLGFTGVWLFFIISGFCIHLRHARAAAGGPGRPLDFAAFWKRRLVRLYPAYLVCLLLYFSLSLAGGAKADGPMLYDLFMHLLMIHNFDPSTAYGFAGVFWTLALEEQLYLAYFVLLALRKRLGWGWTLLVCLAARGATYAAHVAARRWLGIELPVKELASAQWFVWALGAVAVEAYVGLVVVPRWCRDPRAGAALLGVAAAAIAFVRHAPTSPLCKPIWFALDPLLGLGFFVLLNAFVASEAAWTSRGKAPKAVRRLARVGALSYSLYLTHEIVIAYFSEPIARWFGVDRSLPFLLALTPLCLALAWVFFQLFERPFIHGPLGLPAARLFPAPKPKPLPAAPL